VKRERQRETSRTESTGPYRNWGNKRREGKESTGRGKGGIYNTDGDHLEKILGVEQ